MFHVLASTEYLFVPGGNSITFRNFFSVSPSKYHSKSFCSAQKGARFEFVGTCTERICPLELASDVATIHHAQKVWTAETESFPDFPFLTSLHGLLGVLYTACRNCVTRKQQASHRFISFVILSITHPHFVSSATDPMS